MPRSTCSSASWSRTTRSATTSASPQRRPSGTIARIFRDRGYGFIVTDGGEEVYFHRNALHELDFTSLQAGLPVELEIVRGKRGPQASRVFPVGERMAT
jgi:cold shock CspA family protein